MEAATLPEGFSAVASPPIANGSRPAEVTLGDVTVPVYPQRHAYLANRLGKTLQGFVESGEEVSTENFIAFLGGGAYDVLAALIPALPSRLPRHVFAGFPSEEAMDEGTYDEISDKSPTFPEIVSAFEAAWRVNRFDVLGKLGSLVDPTMLKAWLRVEMAKRLSMTSQSSQPQSGESDPMSSGPTSQTSPPSEA